MAVGYESIWLNALQLIKSRLNPQSFRTWFEGTKGIIGQDDSFTIRVKDQFTADWLEQHYLEFIYEIVGQLLNRDSFEISFAVMQANGGLVFTKPTRKKVYKKYDNDTGNQDRHLNPNYTFGRFVVGDFNSFAHAAAMAVAEAPGQNNYNPLYIYGGVGLGKTHLLQSIGHFVKEENPKARVMYVTGERFTSEYIGSLLSKTINEFKSVYRSIDVLLMDDIQFFSGKEGSQEQFFHLFNSLHQSGKQIVLTSDLPPSRIVGLEDRLLSRFKWGLVVDIKPPDFESRIAILRKKSANENVFLNDDVLYYVAENVTSNIRALEGTLIRLLAHASIHGGEITIKTAREVISHYHTNAPRQSLNIGYIIEKVCEVFNVTKNDIVGKRRTKDIAMARQVAMYLSREMTDNSLASIGLAIGGRDHSTVVYAHTKITKMMEKDTDLADIIQNITSNY